MAFDNTASSSSQPANDTADNNPLWQQGLFAVEKRALAPDRPAAPQDPGLYTSVKMNVDGQQREYEVYRSTHFDPSKPARVIMAFHGSFFGQDGARGLMARETGIDKEMEQRADAGNTLVVYPLANNRTATMLTGQAWNYAGHRNIFDTWHNYDDGKYMDQVLADLKKHVQINQLDGVGFGDGGRFLKQYSDDHPGMFRKVVLDNATTLGDSHNNPTPGVKTDYLIMEADRDPKTGFFGRLAHPFTKNLMLPYAGGSGGLADVTPNLGGIDDSRPDQLKVEAARSNSCTGTPQVTENGTDIVTTFNNCAGGTVTEDFEKNGQFAWNDTKHGDGGHGIFALFGSRSDFNDTGKTLDFILKPDAQPPEQTPKPPEQTAQPKPPEQTAQPPEQTAQPKPPEQIAQPKPPEAPKQPEPLPYEGTQVTDIDPSINPRLGCALAVSAALNKQDGSIAVTNNVDQLKRELQKAGYQMQILAAGELKIDDLKQNDVILGYREGHMPRHSAIYKGDGKLFQNDRNTGTIVGNADVQEFNQKLYDAKGNFHPDGYKRIIILRKPAA